MSLIEQPETDNEKGAVALANSYAKEIERLKSERDQFALEFARFISDNEYSRKYDGDLQQLLEQFKQTRK